MQRIFVIGAGKSSSVLIQYLLERAESNQWHITVGDMSSELAEAKVGGHPHGSAIAFHVEDAASRRELISKSDLVISLLPAFMHVPVASDCVEFGKHFISASYVSDEMAALHDAAVKQGVVLLNECGLDPGIDHMTAMQLMHHIEQKGGVITGFESYTGGLISPESDNNPWHYKLTWNPRNIVMAGQGVAGFTWKDRQKLIPYSKLFTRYDLLEIPGYGWFEGYPNRDSNKYKNIYQLHHTHTLVRGTLRKQGFCDAWNVLVQLGMTDDSYTVDLTEGCTWAQFVNTYLPFDAKKDIREKFIEYFALENALEVMEKLDWLGLFSDRPVGHTQATPARILQTLLEDKWQLEPGDKDMIVMLHKLEYTLHGVEMEAQMSFVVTGQDEVNTAMATTVGLPLGMAAKQILSGHMKQTGVVIPITADIYEPILRELQADFGVRFMHSEKEIKHV
jgi:saccharopine dehydrogenase-like NADP-dependent oxidoreductase